MDPVFPYQKYFCQTLSREAWTGLIGGIPIQTFDDKKVIHQNGEMGTHLFVLCSGAVKFSKTDISGRSVTLAILQGDAFFGLAPLICDVPHRYDAISDGGCTLALIPKNRLLKQISNEEALRDIVLLHLSSRLMHTLDLLDEERRGTVVDRLAFTLLRHCDINNSVTVSQMDLAQQLGVSRNAIGTALQLLSSMKFVEQGYRKITIVGPDNLRKWLSGRV